MMRNVQRTRKLIIHCIAHCEDCHWIEEGYTVAARKATWHSRSTGHTVAVEQGITYQVKPL